MRVKSSLVILAVSTLIVTVPVHGVLSQASWVSFTPPAGEFQVEMPTPPQTSQVQDNSPIGTVTTQIFTAKEGEASFSVSYSNLPALAVQFMGAEGLINQAKSSMLKDQNAREIAFEAAAINGLPGKRLLYEATKDGLKRTGEAFFTLNGTRLYVVDTLVPPGSEALAQKFFQSFRVK